MFRFRRLLLASVLVSSALCVVPMSASADIYCVEVDPCVHLLEAGTTQTTIQLALDAAAANGVEDDVILVGSRVAPYVGPFVYNDPEKVTLLGLGDTKPRLTSGGVSTALQLLGNPASKVQNFKIDVPVMNNSQALNWTGLAEDLEISYTGADLGVRGVLAAPGATLRNSTIDIDNTGSPGYGAGVEATFATGLGVALDNVTISGDAGAGVRVASADVQVSITRSTITAGLSAVRASGVSSEVTASQSVLQSTDQATADATVNILSGATFIGDHVTLRGVGTAPGVSVVSPSIGPEFDSLADLKNSIISDVLLAGSSSGDGATVQSTYTLLPQPFSVLSGGVSITGIGTLTGAPNYFNAVTGDFRLTAPQASIDAGDPADVTTIDRAGKPRVVDGDSVPAARSDLGAFEYQAAAPAVTINAPATVPAGASAAFSAAATDSDPGDTISYAWNFGDGTAAGSNVTHAFATFGEKTVTVTATDQIGRASSSSVVVRVIDDKSPTPRITSVKLNKQRTALLASLGCPASEVSCKFRYSLTTAKKVRVGGKLKIVTLAKTATVTTVGGRTSKLAIKLNKTARALLAKGALQMKLRVKATDPAQNTAEKTIVYKAKQGSTGRTK